MNWIITTRIPYPRARTAMPRHEVVFPFPSPVRTRTSPRRGFSGIFPSRFLAMTPSSRLRWFASRFPCTMITLSETSRQAVRGPDGRENETLHGLREGKGLRGIDLRGVQGDDPRRGLGKGEEDQTGCRAGDPPGGGAPETRTGGFPPPGENT